MVCVAAFTVYSYLQSILLTSVEARFFRCRDTVYKDSFASQVTLIR